jgi:plasmid stabilization system protein ParE
MTAYDFHPEARPDLDEIWEFIRADSLDAADRLVEEILSKIRALVHFPIRAIDAPILLPGHCASFGCVNI